MGKVNISNSAGRVSYLANIVFMYRLIAEHLSVRLLILQCVFSVGWVWPQLLFCLGMQLKVWLVPKHRMLLKILFTQVVYTYVSVSFLAL